LSNVKSKRQARKFRQLSTKYKLLVVIAILALLTGGIYGIIYGLQALGLFSIGGAIPTVSNSHVYLTDWTSGENLNALCPVTILGNKVSLSDPNEIYDLSNYESVVTAKYPEDISEDLTEYDYVIIIVNPNEATDGYWTRDYHLFQINGVNQDFYLYAYHESTDIYGNILDRDSGTAWTGAADGNYTTFLWFPAHTESELHQGTDWSISEELSELSSTTLEKLYNEKYWRCQPVIFDMNDDQADHERSGDYATITETSAIKFDFNDTIGSSTSVTAVNITVTCDIDFQIEYGSGADTDKLYIVFTETWDTLDGPMYFDFEISMGANITCSNVYAGRITIPGRYFNDVAPTFTSLQTIV